jgi:ribonuclease HI
MALIVFADGASSGNPGPGGWGAIVVDETQQVQELGGGSPQTTNNRMELMAVTEALRLVSARTLPGAKIEIYTDSTYVIQGVSRWIHGWKRNGWKTVDGKDVANREYWEALEVEILTLKSRTIEWLHVPGHAGIAGNERADEIAVQFSKNQMPSLYSGPLKDYAFGILEIPSRSEMERLLRERPEKPSKKPSGQGGPVYYLSLIGTTLERHSSWAECEARVKGQSGARYKKVGSPEEEKETLKKWGLS